MTVLTAYLLDQLGVTETDRLAVVADADRAGVGRALVREARGRGAAATLVVTSADYRREADMPAAAIAAVDEADVALLLVDQARVQFGGHSSFRRRATARGARVGFVTHDPETVDPVALAAAAETTTRVAALLSAADRAVVTSPVGAHLEFDLQGRSARALHNGLQAPGAWGALPDFFEAAIAPVEGSSTGRAVIDGTCLVTGVASEPMDLAVRHGEVTDLRGGRSARLRDHLDDAGAGATNLAELGIGTRVLASGPDLTGGFLDKRIAGTAHLGIGDNLGLGGQTRAAIHTDVQLLDVTVELDGRPLVERGILRGS